MAKNKGARIIITLRCTECEKGSSEQVGKQRNSRKIDYTTKKNRRNTPDRLLLKKYCPNCNRHTHHKEIK